MIPDDREHILHLRAEFARERAKRDLVLHRRRCLTPPDKLAANAARAAHVAEQTFAARHAEYVARAEAIRDAAIEATHRAYEEAERRRQAARLRAEAILMWEVAP